MKISYRGYQFPLGSAAVTITADTIRNAAMVPLSVMRRWTFNVMLVGTSVANVHSKVTACYNAFAVDNGDLLWLSPTGQQLHALRSIDTLGGVRITAPVAFPETKGPNGVTFRVLSITAEAECPVTASAALLMDFQESLEFSGGGPRYAMIETHTGTPVRQQTRAKTIYRATQSGTATGYMAEPVIAAIAPPLWPNAMNEPKGRISRSGPQRRGYGAQRRYTAYTVTWQYDFESATPLSGNPHLWITG